MEELHLRTHRYREPGPDGEYLYETDPKRVTERVWELIRLRRAGKPLPEHWLADNPEALRAARIARAERLEREASKLLKKITELVSRVQALEAEAKSLRAAAR